MLVTDAHNHSHPDQYVQRLQVHYRDFFTEQNHESSGIVSEEMQYEELKEQKAKM